jgi:hypothetical protein
MGTSLPSSTIDEDLDRHVAELIVREAKKKAELYMQSGIRAYTNNNLCVHTLTVFYMYMLLKLPL